MTKVPSGGSSNRADNADQIDKSVSSRRKFLAAGAALTSTAGILAASTEAAFAQEKQAKESLLDIWMRDGKARIGADLTAPPLRFRDKDGNPTGMGIEILMLMLDDIGVEAEFVEMPFAQTFAALASGRFDMIGSFVTMLPSRSLRGAFAGFPTYYQQSLAYLKPGNEIQSLSDLNNSSVSIACQQGTSEETTANSLFPNANIQTFSQITDAFGALGTGRVDSLIADVIFFENSVKTFPDITVFSESVSTVPNTFFMAADDFKLWTFVTNWLRFQASLGTLTGLKDKWLGTELRDKYKIPSVTVGAGGEPVMIQPS